MMDALARSRTVWVWWLIDLVGVVGFHWLADWGGADQPTSWIFGFGAVILWNLNQSRLETLRLAAAFTKAVRLANPPSRSNPRDN